jgi:hypothetical protein
MKTNETVLLARCLLAMGLIAPSLHAQNFTFTTLAGGSQGSADGSNSAAQFSKPAGTAVDSSGNIFVADYLNNVIRKITPSGTNWIVTTIAGGTSGILDGTNSYAQFSGPTGIALDSAANIYVSDQLNYTIRKITPSGTNWVVTTIAGQARVHGAQDGANTNAHFYNPTGVAVDTNGNIFVADEFNNTIRKITPVGTNWIVSTIAGQTNAGFQDGTNTAAQFSGPAGVAVDANDNVFVTDQFNNAIRLLTAMGTNWVVTTLAGQLNAGAANGLGTNAQFNSPVGIALDTNGNLYVTDLFNNAIRKMTPSGTSWLVSTVGGGSQGANNGTGTNAQFSLPFGVAADVYGDIFVADYGNNAIRLGLSSSGAPQTGSLEVTLPSNAVVAGVEWQLDGGPFQISGTTLSNLSPGIHTVAFSTNSGYTTPDDQIVTVTAHQTVTTTGNYDNVPTYTITLTASPNAGGTANGGGTFTAGSSNVLTATANSGYEFTNWTENGSVASTSSNYIITLGSNVTLVANFMPTNITPSYTLTVSAWPASAGTVSAGGTNGGGIFPQGSSNTVMATPNSGFEFIGWAADATGTINPLTVVANTNLHITGYFAPIGSLTFIVITTGSGAVSPNLNGTGLKAGRNYSLRATAESGNVFAGWTGSITTNKNPLTIKAESSLVLQANFIPNPFLPVKGTYNGLFIATNGVVTEETSGMLKGLVISQKGTYSGTLLINGGSHAISGSFDLAGQATNKVSRAASQGGSLLVEMTLLNSSNLAPQVTGIVSGTTDGAPWVANLIADRATNTLPSAEYTMLIPPGTNNSSPGGDGYALITNHAGTTANPAASTVRITGALADGTAFNQSAPVSQDGYVPIYANLYASKGLLLGWINLDLTNTNAVAFTSLTWIHPERASGLYQSGFTNSLYTNQILLSLWADPPANIIDLLTNFSMFDNIYNTNALLSYPVAISSSGEISPAPLSGSVNSKTGLLKVTIGSGASRVSGYGAILLNGTNGGGYFLTKTQAQAIQLGP